jgi:hypothetical protein
MSKKVSYALQTIFFVGFLLLLGAIIYGVVAKDIIAEGNIMLAVYWGKFTFIDIYIAFIAFYLWIVFREKSILKSIIWFFLIMLGGSMSILLYLFLAVRSCEYSWAKLIVGNRLESILKNQD